MPLQGAFSKTHDAGNRRMQRENLVQSASIRPPQTRQSHRFTQATLGHEFAPATDQMTSRKLHLQELTCQQAFGQQGTCQCASAEGAQMGQQVRENREKPSSEPTLRRPARTPLFDIAQHTADCPERLAIGRLKVASVTRIARDRHFAMESVERAIAPPAFEQIVGGA